MAVLSLFGCLEPVLAVFAICLGPVLAVFADGREETLVARTKRYGQAVQYALTSMPTEIGDLPSWFNMVENVWS